MHPLLTTIAFLVAASVFGFAATGEIADNTYNNKFVGLRFPVPTGWYAATDAHVTQGIKEGARLVGLDSTRAGDIIKQMPGKVLLIVSKEPLDKDLSALNRNMIVAAIDVRGHKDEIGSVNDYMVLVSKRLRKQFPNAVVSDFTLEEPGNEMCLKLDVRPPTQGTTPYQRYMAYMRNDYLVILNLTAESSSGLEELASQANTFASYDVSKEVDGSPEGQSFRRQATFALPSPPSGNHSLKPLKTIGIILMVGGAVWMLRNLFRRKNPSPPSNTTSAPTLSAMPSPGKPRSKPSRSSRLMFTLAVALDGFQPNLSRALNYAGIQTLVLIGSMFLAIAIIHFLKGVPLPPLITVGWKLLLTVFAAAFFLGVAVFYWSLLYPEDYREEFRKKVGKAIPLIGCGLAFVVSIAVQEMAKH